MTFRVTNQVMQSSLFRAITESEQRAMRLQQSLADGKAIHAPSDDPTQTSMAMWYGSQVRAQDQYGRNLDAAIRQLTTRESTLSQIQDVLGQIRSAQTSAADDSLGADARTALSHELNQYLESLVDLGNTTDAGTYIFGGGRSTEPPIVAQRDAEGRITGVTVNSKGVTSAWTRMVGPDVSLVLHADAADVFGSKGGLFQQVRDLRDALAANDGDRVRAMTGSLQQWQEHVDLAETTAGSLIARANSMKEATAQASTNFQAGRSAAEDVDMAKAAVESQVAQNALQAILTSGSRILQMGLLDYLS